MGIAPQIFDLETAEIAKYGMDRVAITAELRRKLAQAEAALERGLVTKLLEAHDCPDGLNAAIIKGWISGELKTARPDHLSFTLDRLRNPETLPKKPVQIAAQEASFDKGAGHTRKRKSCDRTEGRISLTPEVLRRVETEKQRTGMGSRLLLRYADDVPPGLTAGILDYWLTGQIKSAAQEHVDFVLAAYAKQPDKGVRERPTKASSQIELTDEHIATLKRLKQETGFGPMRLLAQRDDVPTRLNSGVVQSWLMGNTKTAKVCDYNYVLSVWQKVAPDITLTSQRIAKLKSEKERTGIGWSALMAHIADCPAALTPNMLSRWANSLNETAKRPIWNLVIETYASLPEASVKAGQPKSRSETAPRLRFEDHHRQALEDQRARTGVYQGELLERVREGQPKSITAGKISAWVNGSPVTVPADLYDWVLKAWLSLPDRGSRDDR